MPRNRLRTFIVLNIIISAATTMAVLFIYDRFIRPDCATSLAPGPNLSQTTPLAGDIKMDISSVIGAGVAESEILVLTNNGSGSVSLFGWILRTDGGEMYTFAQLEMHPGAVVQVHTTTGSDTAVNLYWGRSEPAWGAGEVASLYDAQGNLRAVYRIP